MMPKNSTFCGTIHPPPLEGRTTPSLFAVQQSSVGAVSRWTLLSERPWCKWAASRFVIVVTWCVTWHAVWCGISHFQLWPFNFRLAASVDVLPWRPASVCAGEVGELIRRWLDVLIGFSLLASLQFSA